MTLSQTILNLEDLPCARANFRFVKDDPIYQTETPYEAIGTLPPEEEHLRSNLKWEERDVPVHDLRQHVDSLSIETNGFEFLQPKELTTLDWDSEKAVVDYLTSLLKFLKERFHTDDVIIYNYNVRLYPSVKSIASMFHS